MPLLLRFLTNKQARWEECKGLSQWPPDDVPADILVEFETKGNKLSVYQVEDDRSNLDITIAALAANRQNLQPFYFVLFDSIIPSNLSIDIEKTEGKSKDSHVNQNFHFELKKLSGKKISEFARQLLMTGQVDDRDIGEVARLINQSVDAGRIDWESLHKDLRKGIEKELR